MTVVPPLGVQKCIAGHEFKGRSAGSLKDDVEISVMKGVYRRDEESCLSVGE